MPTSLRTGSRKKIRAARNAYASAPAAGRHTLSEILSQPAVWRETSKQLEQQGTLEQLSKIFPPRSPWLFLACGSSYYLSQIVAALWTRQLQARCTAVPASEFLFAPGETIRRTGAPVSYTHLTLPTNREV